MILRVTSLVKAAKLSAVVQFLSLRKTSKEYGNKIKTIWFLMKDKTEDLAKFESMFTNDCSEKYIFKPNERIPFGEFVQDFSNLA